MKSAAVFEIPTPDGAFADLIYAEDVKNRRADCYLHYAYAVGAAERRWVSVQSRRAIPLGELRNWEEFKRRQPAFFNRLIEPRPYMPGESVLRAEDEATARQFAIRTTARLGALELLGNIFSGRIQAIDKDPFPHQLALQQFMNHHGDKVQRLLIADEVGLGKTIEIGLVLRDILIARGSLDGFSCVYFTKGGLVADAAGKLRTVLIGALGQNNLVEEIDSLTSFGKGITNGVRVASLEAARLYTKEKGKKKLQRGVAPEIVIIDECHRCASDMDLAGKRPAATNATLTYVAAHQLIRGTFWPESRPPRLVVLMSATPFRSRNQFANLLRLLIDQVNGMDAYESQLDENKLTSALKLHEPAVAVVWRQQDDPSVHNWKSEPLFPRLRIVRPHLSGDDPQTPLLAEASPSYLALMGEIRKAMREISIMHGMRFSGFQLGHLEKRLTSSSLAGACFLFSWALRRSRWETQEAYGQDRSPGTMKLRELIVQISRRLARFSGREHEDVQFPSEGFVFTAKALAQKGSVPDIYKFYSKIAQADDEDSGFVATPTEIERIAGLALSLLGFSDPQQDGGVENAKLHWLRQMLEVHPQARYLVFTESLQTCAIIQTAFGSICRTLTGALGAGARAEVAERFKNPRSKVRLLVATSAADEGFDFQVANRVVHWDVSTSPAVLMQRNGRVARLGQIADVTAYYLIVRKTHEERRDNMLRTRFTDLGIDDERLRLKILGTLTPDQSEDLSVAVEKQESKLVGDILERAKANSAQMDSDLRSLHKQIEAESALDRGALQQRLQRWERIGLLSDDELKIKFDEVNWERPVFRDVTRLEPARAVKATLRGKDQRPREVIFDPEFKVFGPGTNSLPLAGLRPWTLRRDDRAAKIVPDESVDPLGAQVRRVARMRCADFAILPRSALLEALPELSGAHYLLFATHPMREGESIERSRSAPYLTFYAFSHGSDSPLQPAGASAMQTHRVLQLLESQIDGGGSLPALAPKLRQDSLDASQRLASWLTITTQLGEGTLLEEDSYFLPIPVGLIAVVPDKTVTSTASMGDQSLIDRLLLLTATGANRQALAIVFDVFDRWHRHGDFAASDAQLAELPVDKLSPSVLVGTLTITAAARELLPSRMAFFKKVQQRLETLLLPEELHQTLRGLE